MLNETFSVIFKHCEFEKNTKQRQQQQNKDVKDVEARTELELALT